MSSVFVMDIDKFQYIVRSIRPQLLQTAKNMGNNNAESEDLVQEVFLRLWQVKERLNEYKNLEHIAKKTLRNICIDKYRRKKINYEELTNYQIKNNSNCPQAQLEIEEDVRRLIEIIQRLPELQQLIIKMKDVEGYEIEEIVKITQSSAESIRMNLSRARKKVREIFLNENPNNY